MSIKESALASISQKYLLPNGQFKLSIMKPAIYSNRGLKFIPVNQNQNLMLKMKKCKTESFT